MIISGRKAVAAAVLLTAILLLGGCFKAKEKSKAPALDDASTLKKSASSPSQGQNKTSTPSSSTGKEPARSEFNQDDGQNTQAQGQSYATGPFAASPEDKPESPAALSDGTTSVKARLAIVIDDFGYRNQATDRILALGYPITCAVLPDAKTTARDAADCSRAGKLVILHMPMEALDGTKSYGEGFIRSGMEEGEVRARLHMALSMVPEAEGVSNHMGSKVSQDAAVMEALLAELKELGLFYLDSKTISNTVGPEVGRKVGVDVYVNGTFIDSTDDVSYIEGKIMEAAEKALRDGQAVAIGHVKSSTADALENLLPKLSSYGVELVFVNELKPVR